jgi:hypothetical protein
MVIPQRKVEAYTNAKECVVCAADAAIWAAQQLVAIPGWLREDQNARLDQEGQFASVKEPRSLTTKKNKAKRRTIYCGATFGPRPASFQKSLQICGKSGEFEANSQDASFWETMADFP